MLKRSIVAIVVGLSMVLTMLILIFLTEINALSTGQIPQNIVGTLLVIGVAISAIGIYGVISSYIPQRSN